MKIDLRNCSELELWHYVAVHLKKHDIDTVLVGGAVVSIYTNGAYKSGDLDFVKLDLFTTGLEKAMKEIGFEKKGTRHYIHKDCKHLFVEFPGGPPVGIREDNSITPDEVEVDGQIIKIYSPTDCVKDRLASYIHFKAQECLDQAVMVAKKHPVRFEEIKKWCLGEKGESQWEDFIEKLKK
ncbi:hypothetical protein [Halobacteriovorax sp.]|uniref:hypothetical protein n=1 Tax=Halobacteriovorax sp. TaxID=2020862 RepID=UPI0035677D59